MWKLKRSQYYFGNCDIDLTSSGTFWTMPSHYTLLTFHFSSKYELVCVCRAGGSMIECLNLYKRKKQTVRGSFFLLLVDSVTFCFQKICMFNIIWMKDICIVEYCTENCCVIRLYLFLKFWTHFEFWFVLNTVFLALLFDHVNMKTSK